MAGGKECPLWALGWGVWTNTSRDGLEGSGEGEMGCGAMYRCSGTSQSPLPVQWFGFGLGWG